MKKISSSVLLTIFTKLLIILFLAKAISLAGWFYLPNDGVELSVSNSYQAKYQRVNFKNMLEKTVAPKKVVQKKIKKEPVKNGINITNMILKGLYGAGAKGFAIVALKSKPKKTSIIGIGEIFEGYRLTYINSDSVVFDKNDKEYILTLIVVENSSAIQKVKKGVNRNKTVDSSDEPRNVSRGDIAYYAKNPKQIWRDISIKEVKENGKIVGFKVTRVTRRSKMALLGLQKGDVIIRANNIKLTSYRDALKLYKNIKNIETMEIVVIRDNQEKELVYEIN